MRAKFAVVGHPNKGKSSIVSTLSRSDRVEISSRSGTTKRSQAFAVETSNSAYELIDTPGFQRPRKVLAWLQKRAAQADQRAAAVASFVKDEQCQRRFPDEVELLTPIVKGAAILFVVDGSRPYDVDYEAEMEILRWSGQPSMALINPIENDSFVSAWQSALAQYFKTVRVFDPYKAEFESQIELLSVFSHLQPKWAHTLNQVTQDLLQQRVGQTKQSATVLSRLVEDLCFYRCSQKVLTKDQAETVKPVLAKQYTSWMAAREANAMQQLLEIYAHSGTNLSLSQISHPPDLFDLEHWYAWGLNKKQLTLAATVGGVASGGAIDLALGGQSFLIGALSGGMLGAGSAWFGANKLVKTRIKGLPLGGFEACYGPVSNPNFPYVVVGRFLYLHDQISRRNHAQRTEIKINPGTLQQKIDSLEKSDQKTVHKACMQLVKQKTVEHLPDILFPLF